jgi:hypothetical protein
MSVYRKRPWYVVFLLHPSKKIGIFPSINQSINAKSAKNTTAATKTFGQFCQQHLPIFGKL